MLRNSTEKRVHIPALLYSNDLLDLDHRTISLRAQLRLSYETYPWLRYLTWTGLALLGLLLLLVPGFPPRAFLLFWQTLPLTGRLLAQHGSAALFSLATLGIQVLTWLLLWGLWLAFSHALARYTWRLARTRSLLGTGWLPSSALNGGLINETGVESERVNRKQSIALEHGSDGIAGRSNELASITPACRDEARLRLLPPTLSTSRTDGSPRFTSSAIHADGSPRFNASAIHADETLHSTAPKSHVNRAESATLKASTQRQSRQFIQPPLVRPRAQSLSGETLAGWPTGPRLSGTGVAWDVGITRKGRPNEDSVLTLRGTCSFEEGLLPFELHIVADGMGGHAHGRLASHLALRGMLETVVPGLLACKTLENEGIVDTLIDGVQWANQVIYQYSREQGAEMGTTITAVLLLNETAYIINVGDSRTYIYRPHAGLTQITRDHSLVARLVENGTITPDEVYTHPDRNKVYRGLGDKTEVTVDWFVLPVQSGDLLLLCSDGLWEMVRDPQMAEILTTYAASPTLASHALLRAALQAGGNDNVSMLVVGV